MSAFDRIIGYEKEKEVLYRLCDMARNPAKYATLGVRPPRGVLLHGVPGVGKTLMASAFIEETGRACYTCRKDQANEAFIGEIRKAFAEAEAHAPSVVFLDDLDKFSADGELRNPEELIAVQSGIDKVSGADVFVVATANRIRDLPRSLCRAGRFDCILEIFPPDQREAAQIVRYYLKDKKVSKDISAESIARLLDGNSCAELESVLNEAGMYAGYENKAEISREHIVRSVLHNVFHAGESVDKMSAAEKEEIAFHEAGHAVSSLAFRPGSVGLISVRSGKGDMRGVVQIFKDGNCFGSYGRMSEYVVMLLSGRAAVELRYGRLDIGAASDIERATELVQKFVAEYAASGFGLSSPDPVCFITASGTDEKIVTERGAMLTRFYEQAKSVLRRHWPLVEALAAELVKRDTLIYEEIRTICERVEKRFERGEKKKLQKVGEGRGRPSDSFLRNAKGGAD